MSQRLAIMVADSRAKSSWRVRELVLQFRIDRDLPPSCDSIDIRILDYHQTMLA